MLVSQLNPKALAAFHLTTLESGPWRGLPVEADLGVPVSVFDTAPYCVPNTAQPLHPDDEALLEVRTLMHPQAALSAAVCGVRV